MAMSTTRGALEKIAEKSHLLSKFQGCLVGALAGDCVGALFEFEKPNNEVLQDCIDRTSSGDSHMLDFTDDTAMARSVAKSLIKNKTVNTQDLAKRFSEEFFKEPHRGYGASVGIVFAELKNTNYADPHGPASKQFDGRGSYGNGGAMRICPLALFAYKHDANTMQKSVEDITRITHSNQDAINGAQLQCAAVHYALHQEPPLVPTEFLDHLVSVAEKLEGAQETAEQPEKKLKQDEQQEEEEEEEKEEKLNYSSKLKIIKEMISQEKIDDEEAVEVLGNDVSALGSVTTAIYCFIRAQKEMDHIPKNEDDNELTRTIIHAISLGGDTDTIATMAGAMTGALHGIKCVPKNWQHSCEALKDYLQFAKELADIVHP